MLSKKLSLLSDIFHFSQYYYHLLHLITIVLIFTLLRINYKSIIEEWSLHFVYGGNLIYRKKKPSSSKIMTDIKWW
jgi:hypothetical protein